MILKAAKRKKLKLVTNPSVIQETIEHLSKLNIEPVKLEKLLTKKILSLKSNPKAYIQERFSKVVKDPDDIHVIAGASLSGANFLVSLDKKHILTPTVKKLLKPMQVVSPKEFWGQFKKNKQPSAFFALLL